MNNIEQDRLFNKNVTDLVKKLVPEILRGEVFTTRKITDTPTDALSVTPRKYVTMNGSVAGRPINSVVGQFYFNTDTNTPMWRGATGRFYNGVGSIIA